MAKKEDVVFKVSADEAKAIEGFRKLVAAQTKVEDTTKKAAKASKGQKDNFDKAAGSIAKLGLGLVGLDSAMNVFQKGIGLSKEFLDNLNEIGKKSNEKARSLRSYFSIMPSDAKGQGKAKDYLLLGAQMGFKSDAAAQILEPLISKFNTGGIEITDEEDKEIRGRAGYALKAGFIGIDPEMAGKIEIMGAARGMGAGVATGQLLRGASASNYSKQDMGLLASSMAGFREISEGAASAVALGNVYVKATEAREMLKGAGRILGAEGDTTDFIKDRKLAGASTGEKIRALREEAITKGDQALPEQERIAEYTSKMASMGMDMVSARGLKAIIDNAQSYFDAEKTIKATGAEYVEKSMQDVLSHAGQKEAFEEEKTAALTSHNIQFGDIGKAGREESAKRKATGTALQRGGVSVGYDLETGEASWWGSALNYFSDAMSGGAAGSYAYLTKPQSFSGDIHKNIGKTQEVANAEFAAEMKRQNDLTAEANAQREKQYEEQKRTNDLLEEKRESSPTYNTEGNN